MSLLKDFLNSHNITSRKIAVGVSGGSDSLALALMAQEELLPLGYQIIALTVDHRLRPASSQEAAYVGEIMRKYGIEHHILVWEGSKPESGIEEAARKARYALFGQWCAENRTDTIMTAHHLYDQAETFFIRLQRGSGLDGLCGMQNVFATGNLKILRPLLQTPPQKMKEYLRGRHIAWVEDESNDCPDFLRGKLRRLLPDFLTAAGITPQRIAETMQRLQSSRCYLEKQTQKACDNYCRNWYGYAWSCSRKAFAALESEIQFRLLALLLKNTAGSDYPPRAESIIRLAAAMQNEDFGAATLGYCYICRHKDILWFFPEQFAPDDYSREKWKKYLSSHPELKKREIPFRLKVFLTSLKTGAENCG